MKRAPRPVLITDAEQSQDDQLRARELRYLLMMSIRAVSLVVAAVLVSVHAPLLWLWIPLCLAGMLVVPWLAVILANDRPPKARYRVAYRLHRSGRPEEEKEQAPLPTASGGRVIDADQ